LSKHIVDGRIREIVQGRFIACENLSQIAQTLYNSIEKLHLEKPLSLWFERRDIRAAGPKEDILFDAALVELAADKRIEEQGGKLRKAGYRAPLSDKQVKLIERILDEMRREPYDTHKPVVLAENWKIPLPEIEKVYRILIQQQEVIELPDGVFLAKAAVAEAEGKLRRHFEGAELLRSGDFKDIIGSSRKTAISLLDYFEKTGITIRRGNEHALRKFGAKLDQKTSE
jgi:selenocysteine-specific elongation factor